MFPRLDLEIAGTGSAVLLLHGTPTPWDILRPVSRALVGKQTLLAALPGYGQAPPWPGHVAEDDIVAAIEQAVVGRGIRRLRIIAFSGGAHHALRLAARRTLEIDVLVALGALGDPSEEARAGFRALAADLRSGKNLAGLPTSLFLSTAFAASHPDACARVETWMSATSPENLSREFEAVANASPFLPALASFEGRVVARTGAMDRATPPAHAEAIARVCPNAVLQIVPGCGHALLEEDPQETLRACVAAVCH